ncbi:WD repeat-containing protein 91 [Pleodorina starrii]|uniref:WD repeat-containing protein 91 n=1 Tax=Pleodorina starrii TaxID=330485 RepID=A0A9W6F4H8_9CHLO|nr:WD repeat-containing protein 91 [Pleodorina starrii]GLC56218.1 WD repeat-containing protein 91 [Pleodorina starrii]GLC69148.1 WD repeat-containing protein 91 [Pleodorina starrii]
MDSLPYVDTLFKEYLLFRGFTATLQSFGAELAADRCCGFQAEALCELIFGQLLPQCRTTQLMELLELLADRLYSQLDGRFEALVERMEVALVKAALVTCVRSGKQDKVSEFFRHYGDSLLSGPEAGVWRQWAALAFVPTPRKDPAFQAYFNPEWLNLLEVSFRNFLCQVMASLPLPAVLRFNADRRQRLALQQQVDSLQRQLETTTQRLAAATQQLAATAAAAQLAAAAEARQRADDADRATRGGATADPATPAAATAVAADGTGAAAPGTAPSRARSPAAAAAASAPAAAAAKVPAPAAQPRPSGGDEAAAAAKRRPKSSSAPPPSPPLSSSPPPPPSAPRLSSPTSLAQQPQPLLHHPPPHHHGRTLSLEAWHSVEEADDQPEAAAALPIPGTSPAAGVGASVSGAPAAAAVGVGGIRAAVSRGGGSQRTTAAFEGFAAAAETKGDSPPPLGAGGGGGAAASSSHDALAAAPAPSSPSQRPGGSLPPLAEGDGEPAPVPLAAASPPSLASSVAAAAAGGASVAAEVAAASGAASERRQLPLSSGQASGATFLGHGRDLAGGGGLGAGEGPDADVDVDVEEDPAVMLVSGPTEAPPQGPLRRLVVGGGSISDGGDGDGGGAPRSVVVDDDDGTASASASASDDEEEEEEGEVQEEEGDEGGEGAGEASGSGSGDGAAAAVTAAPSAGGASVGSQPRSHTAAVPVPTRPPGGGAGGVVGSAAGSAPAGVGGGAAVVGGGRWQGVSTHSAAPGTLHRRGAAVLAAQFSPGGGHNVATGAADGSVAIWSATASSSASTSPREARLACGAPVTCVAWDARADKIMLVGTGGHGILAWHADTRRTAAEIPPDPAFPWISQLACSRKEPVFIVAAATAPPPGSGAAAAAAAAAAAPHPSSNPHAHQHRHQHRNQGTQQPAAAVAAVAGSPGRTSQLAATGGGGGSSSGFGGGGSSGRLSLWNMRAYKRVSSYTVPQNSPVLSLAFNSQGSWFAAGTCCGDVHLYDSSSSGSKQHPLSSFRANSSPGSTTVPPASAPAAVQVYDSSAETVLVTCCGATVRLWSLRRLAEPLLSVPLLPYLPYSGGACGGWSTDWTPYMCLSPRGAAAAVVLGGGGPAVYVVDLQGSSSDDIAASAAATTSGGGGGGGSSGTWRSGVFGSPASAAGGSAASLNRLATAATAAAVGRVSVILPYCGGGLGLGLGAGSAGGVGGMSELVVPDMSYDLGGGGGGDGGDDWVYGTSCSWHPARDVVVVGYSDGAVQTVGLSRSVGGGGGGGGGGA